MPDRIQRARGVATLFVAAVWIAMFALGHVYVLRYGTRVPALDDVVMADDLARDNPYDERLWWQHNEHRMPLPRVVYLLAIRVTRDFRAGTLVEVWILGAIALGMILASARIRGRVSWTDAFFPLLWLHWGHSENLLNSFQLALIVPTALSCILLVAVAGMRAPDRAPKPYSNRALLAVGLGLVLLPLCGIMGLVQVPPLALWLWFAAAPAARSADRGARRSALLARALAVLACALIPIYFVGFRFLPGFEHAPPARALAVAAQFLTQGLGWPAATTWPWSACLVVGLALASVIRLAVVAFGRAEERMRASGLLACFASSAALALSIGWGRGMDQQAAGFLNRYTTPAATCLCAVYLSWCSVGPVASARAIRILLFAVVGAALVPNFEAGIAAGRERASNARAFEADAAAGLGVDELSARYWTRFSYSQEFFAHQLRVLQAAGLAPFLPPSPRADDFAERAAPQSVPFDMMRTTPIDVRSERVVFQAQIDGTQILVVPAEGRLRFHLPEGARRLGGRFGIHPGALREGGCDGVRFAVDIVDGAARRRIFERDLDPARAPADAGFQELAIALPYGSRGELVLITTNAPGRTNVMDWSFWTEVDAR